MANKITIRRVGGLLPAMSLVVLILLASLITWLSTAGLPDCALRALEEEAAKQGIHLRVGKLKLSPASGLAVRVRRVELYAEPGEEKPLATLERATLAISPSALLRGRIQPTMAEFRNLDVSLPTDGDTPLMIEDATASANIRRGRRVQLTSATARLEGIPVTLRGSFLLPQEGEETKADTHDNQNSHLPLDIAALLRPWQKQAGSVQRAISSQNWQRGEYPDIDLQLEVLKETQISARITIPRYDEGQFHFRDASLDIAYRNNTLFIDKAHFHTIEPDSEVTLQGGYDIPERHLSVNLRSTAALTRMVADINLPGVNREGIDPWLQRFHHPDDAPPVISLRGDLFFEEDFSPKSIKLTGEITQKNFEFGQTAIDELHLSFYYRDGTFNIDRLQLAFPSGSLTLSASASAESNKGKARIVADLDIPHLLQFASEFTPEPLTLPDGLELTGNLQLDASAELDMPSFIAGSTQLEQFLPSLHRVELALAIDQASHFGCSMEAPRLSVKLNNLQHLEGELLPRALEQALLSFRAEGISLPQQEGGQEQATTMHQAELELELSDLSLPGGAEGNSLNPRIANARGNLCLASLTMPGFHAEALAVQLNHAEGIRPLEENWRQLIRAASLRLTTGAMHTGDTLLGAVDSRLELDAQGHIDLTAILDRKGHRLNLDLHPQLTEDGLLKLEQVHLNLPAAGFAPLLTLTGINISQIRLPDEVILSGNACYDTRRGYLRLAAGELSIPHLVRTPGERVAAFRGDEIPLSLYLRWQATGREDGNADFDGEMELIHKTDGSHHKERKLQLCFRGNTASQLHLEGFSTLDVATANRLIDLHDAHVIMRDFDTPPSSTSDIAIRAVDINWKDGLEITAACDVSLIGIGYQMNAFVDETNADGKPTGRERLRTDFGQDPFRRVEKGTAHVDVLYRENAQGKVEATRISILNADLTYDNRPWLRSQRIKNGVKSSRLQGEAIIIDVEESFVELRNVRGEAYPAYAIGAYYDELPGFLETLVLDRPASLETQHCLFPIYDDCPHSMSGCIRVLADRAGFRFLGTTFPLRSLSGFIWFREGAVCLDRLNAACWDGAINAAVSIDYSGRRTGFDGYATIGNVNLQPLAAAYGSKQEPALCNGTIRFRTPSPDVDDLKAYGEVHIVNGDLLTLGLFRPVGDLISDLPGKLAQLEDKARHSEGRQATWLDRQMTKLFQKTGNTLGNVGDQVGRVTNNIPFANHFLRYDLQEVHSRFTIGNGQLVTDGMKALGYNLNVGVQLELDLEKLTLEGDLWPKISSVPTILLSPITFLSNFMIDIHVFGPVDDIEWKFGLNRKRPEKEEECSVSSKAPQQQMKPRQR